MVDLIVPLYLILEFRNQCQVIKFLENKKPSPRAKRKQGYKLLFKLLKKSLISFKKMRVKFGGGGCNATDKTKMIKTINPTNKF